MEHYHYKQAAIFADEVGARTAEQHIKDANFPDIKLFVLEPTKDLSTESAKLEPEGKEIPKTVVHDAVYGGAGGAAVGAVASALAGLFHFTLFATHPVVATLASLGYGTALGATGGALVGENLKEDTFLSSIEGALENGHWAIIAHAPDKETSQKISDILAKEQGAEKRVHS